MSWAHLTGVAVVLGVSTLYELGRGHVGFALLQLFLTLFVAALAWERKTGGTLGK